MELKGIKFMEKKKDTERQTFQVLPHKWKLKNIQLEDITLNTRVSEMWER